jgi:hypothetical protein
MRMPKVKHVQVHFEKKLILKGMYKRKEGELMLKKIIKAGGFAKN